MKIRIEQLPREFRNVVTKIGGVPTYYEELDECFQATFYHHEIRTYGDHAEIIDELTDRVMYIKITDFYTIEIM